MSIGKKPYVRIRVTILLRREDGRLCFVRHVKDGRTYWLLPGGGQDPFETLESAAHRELMEELGLTVSGFRFVCLRESFSKAEGRHIQFPVFEGIQPDFSSLGKSQDPRVAGADFFLPEELREIPIYPTIVDDLVDFLHGKPLELFRTVHWVP